MPTTNSPEVKRNVSVVMVIKCGGFGGGESGDWAARNDRLELP